MWPRIVSHSAAVEVLCPTQLVRDQLVKATLANVIRIAPGQEGKRPQARGSVSLAWPWPIVVKVALGQEGKSPPSQRQCLSGLALANCGQGSSWAGG